MKRAFWSEIKKIPQVPQVLSLRLKNKLAKMWQTQPLKTGKYQHLKLLPNYRKLSLQVNISSLNDYISSLGGIYLNALIMLRLVYIQRKKFN